MTRIAATAEVVLTDLAAITNDPATGKREWGEAAALAVLIELAVQRLGTDPAQANVTVWVAATSRTPHRAFRVTHLTRFVQGLTYLAPSGITGSLFNKGVV